MICRRFFFALSCFIAIFCLAGCAHLQEPGGTHGQGSSFWHGRLAVRTEPNPAFDQTQRQAFSAAFELRSNAQSGELLLFSPLGSTIAAIRWTQEGAELQAHGSTRQFDSLQQLVSQAIGFNVPVSALLMWLQGQAVEADGWQVDLSQSGQGKIIARRDGPEAKTELRLMLEQ